MAEPDYIGTIQRIITILKEDRKFSSKIREFRFGELPEDQMAKNFPACYVTLPDTPEVERRMVGSANFGKAPAYTIITEYWVIILAKGSTPEDTQKNVYDLRGDVIRIINNNVRLTDKDDKDSKCDTLTVSSITRLTRLRGRNINGMTVRIRCVNHASSPD